MSSYIDKALDERSYLPKMCAETLELIARLDKASTDIHEEIDDTVKKANEKKMITKRKMGEIESMRNVAESLCEKKAHLALLNYDLIDQHIRQLDAEIKIVEKAMANNGDERLKAAVGNQFSSSSSSARDTSRRRNSRLGLEADAEEDGGDSVEPSVDPNEPVYCTCRQIAFGEMIACDNEDCAVEWFHYACVNLSKKPKSSWLCPDCLYKKKHG
jgi:inhibitor of growth protein 5